MSNRISSARNNNVANSAKTNENETCCVQKSPEYHIAQKPRACCRQAGGKLLENPVEVLENPVEVLENPVELLENLVELLQNSCRIA